MTSISASFPMARRLIPAHAAVRPIKRVRVWDLYSESAAALVEELIQQDFQAEQVAKDGLEPAVSNADIISCATLSQTPLIHGSWLSPLLSIIYAQFGWFSYKADPVKRPNSD